MKILFTTCTCLFFFLISYGQSVSINETGAVPDSSAMLDLSSQTKGFLLPRMNSLERISIPLPQTGLLVYDLDLQSLFYFDGGQWVEFTSSKKGLRDSDNDTKVVVEQGMDDDTIRMFTGGFEKLKIHDRGINYASANSNIYLGSHGYERCCFDNLVIGHFAGEKFQQTSHNVVVGNNAFRELGSGSSNTVIGYQAGDSLAGGSNNVLLGYKAFKAQSGSRNVSLGYKSGNMEGNSAFDNVFIGTEAGSAIAGSMSDNVVIGKNAGYVPQGGDGNVFIGDQAGSQLFGSNDGTIAIGQFAGNLDQGGLSNIFIGKNAGSIHDGAIRSIFIGPNTGLDAGSVFNKLVIDNEQTDKPLIFGDFNSDILEFNGHVGIGTSPSSELHIEHKNDGNIAGLTIQNKGNGNYWRFYVKSDNGNLRLYSKEAEGNGGPCGNNNGAEEYVAWVSSCSGAWNSTSDRRKKKNFDLLPSVLPAVKDLQVLKYHFLSEDNVDKKHIGLVAQEVNKYFPELVNYDKEIDLYTMNYDGFGPIALKAVQELSDENEHLKAELKTQKAEMELLRSDLNNLIEKMELLEKK